MPWKNVVFQYKHSALVPQIESAMFAVIAEVWVNRHLHADRQRSAKERRRPHVDIVGIRRRTETRRGSQIRRILDHDSNRVLEPVKFLVESLRFGVQFVPCGTIPA